MKKKYRFEIEQPHPLITQMQPIRYSILIICYNQEKYVAEAIESCLNQTLMPFEILIADDCSTDRTREIINNYQTLNPNIIKPILNSKNLGIYKNYNNAVSFLSGDIYIGIGGDDYLLPNAIKAIDNLLQEEAVDLGKSTVLITSNNYSLNPDGSLILWDNYKARMNNAFKEQLRLGLNTRDCGISVRTIKNCLIPTDKGISADGLRNLDFVSKTDIFLYTNEVTNVHRVGSGITAKTKMKEYSASTLLFIDLINKERYPQMDNSDYKFIKLLKTRDQMFCANGISFLKYYFLFLFLLFANYNNFSTNNPFISNLRYIIPFYSTISFQIKKIIFKSM